MILAGAIALWLALLLAAWAMLASIAAVRSWRSDLAQSGYRALVGCALALACGVVGLQRAVASGEFRMMEVQYTAGQSDLSVATGLLTPAWWWLQLLLLLALIAAVIDRPSATRSAARVAAARVGIVGGMLLVGLVVGRLWLDPYRVGVVTAEMAQVLDDPRGVAFAVHRVLTAIGVAAVAWSISAIAARHVLRRSSSISSSPVVTTWMISTVALVTGWWWRYAIDGSVDVRSGHWSLRVALVCWGVSTVLLTLLPPRVVRAGRISYGLRWAGAITVLIGMLAQDRGRVERIELPASVARRTTDLFGTSWTLTSQGASYFVRDGVESLLLAIALQRGATREGIVTTEQRRYPTGSDAPPPDRVLRGVHRGLAQDLFVELAGSNGRDVAVVELRFVPAVNLVWCGSVLLLLGMVSAMQQREVV
jgi:hypothetical protein